MYSLKKHNKSLAKHTSWTIKFLLSPPPTNFTVEKKNEKRNKTKNEWCYLLLTYVLHCKKKKKQGHEVHQTKRCQGWLYHYWLAIPICLAFKTVHYSAQHFLNFFVKQHHHRSRHWQNNNKFGISSSKIKTTTNTAAASAHTERMEFGRGLNNWPCPALYRNY